MKKDSRQRKKTGLNTQSAERAEVAAGGVGRGGALKSVFGIDPRSLAVFRVFLGALVLVDLLIRASDLGAMYGDSGMLSRAEIAQRVSTPWNWSFHFGSGGTGYQGALFTIACLLAVALIAGFETRLATIGSWLMLISVQHRLPPVLSGADILLRMLLFWGMFVPLGKAWSLDNHRRKRNATERFEESNGIVVSVGTAAILLQMGMMYLFSALFKSNTEWLQGGVIKASLAHDFYAKPLGTWLLQYPGLLRGMTWVVFLLEWAGPILLFSPWRTSTTRMIAVCSLAAMHIGIALTMEVDAFSPVAIAGLTLFIPRAFWDRLLRMRSSLEASSSGEEIVIGKRSPWHLAGQVLCGIALSYVIWVNLKTLPIAGGTATSAPQPSFLRTACGLGQKWNMFEDAPSKDGWYIAAATLEDGSQVDLLRNGSPVDWSRPARPAAMYPNHRWRKLFREMAYEDVIGYQFFRKPVAEYLARRWNERTGPEKKVEKLDLIYCSEKDVEGSQIVKSTERERITHLDFTNL